LRCSGQEIGEVVRNYGLGVAIDSGLQHHFVVRVCELRPPLVVHAHRFDQSCEAANCVFQKIVRKGLGLTLAGSFENGLIFKQESCSGNSGIATVPQEFKETEAGSGTAAEGGDDDAGIEDETHGVSLLDVAPVGINEEIDDGDDDALSVGAVDEEDGGLWGGHGC